MVSTDCSHPPAVAAMLAPPMVAPPIVAGAIAVLPLHGIAAYRATLRTLAAIEGGGSGDDEGDFRRLVAGIGDAARRGGEGPRLAGAIAGAIARLAAAEQIILQLSLVENCSLAEIGAILDLSPPDIARARRAAIGRLRRDLAARAPGCAATPPPAIPA